MALFQMVIKTICLSIVVVSWDLKLKDGYLEPFALCGVGRRGSEIDHSEHFSRNVKLLPELKLACTVPI